MYVTEEKNETQYCSREEWVFFIFPFYFSFENVSIIYKIHYNGYFAFLFFSLFPSPYIYIYIYIYDLLLARMFKFLYYTTNIYFLGDNIKDRMNYSKNGPPKRVVCRKSQLKNISTLSGSGTIIFANV